MIPPRPEALAISEAVHGALDAAELLAEGIDASTVLDFSASVNPFGPSPAAVAAIGRVEIDRYPDRQAFELRRALAAKLDVPRETVVVGNGSSELLYLAALAFLRPGDAVVVIGPTYSEYARVARLMGARVIPCDAVRETGFQAPAQQVASALKEFQPRALFLCHPNNPTGQCLPTETIRSWAADFMDTLFVIDEAYVEFASACESLVEPQSSNLIVLRSLTKAYGLAGLRLGYAVAAKETVEVLCRVRPPWSVSSVAQAAGIAALADDDHLLRCRRQMAESKAQLKRGLEEIGLCPFPSAAPFLLAAVGDAVNVRKRLLRSRILVRDCSSFNLPDCIRLSPRSSPDNVALLDALRSLVGTAGSPSEARMPAADGLEPSRPPPARPAGE
jgi:histidinol-phosphate aminotransferase